VSHTAAAADARGAAGRGCQTCHGAAAAAPPQTARWFSSDAASGTTSSSKPSLRTKRDPISGFQSTTIVESGSGEAEQPHVSQHEQLKVRLRDESTSEAEQADAEAADALDLFSLSRTLGVDGSKLDEEPQGASDQPNAVTRRVLGPDEQRTLSKLVGCLTKEGKRSRAQRVLGDALQIINVQLRKGGSAAAAGGGGSGGGGKNS